MKICSTPLIHLNGSAASTLTEGYEKAGHAIMRALDALAETTPNARDYYPLGPDAFGAAVREHRARTEALRGAYDQLVFIHRELTEQADIIATQRANTARMYAST